MTSEPTASDPDAPDETAEPDEAEETAEPDEPSSDSPEGDAAPPARRSRLLLVVGAAAAVLLVVLVALLLTRGGDQRDPITVVTRTEPAVSPSPQSDPIERDTSTALLEALPGTVLGYAVSEQTESEQMLDAHALEGWTLTYSEPDTAVVLQVGQWPDGKEAKAAWTALIGDAQPSAEGDVLVGDDTVGGVVTVVDGDVERTIWRNRSAVFVAEGPVGTTQPFFDGFPF